MNRLHRCLSSVLILALLAVAPAAGAADALNGKSLYLNGPVGGGTACASCHGPTPANNVNGILAAANKPAVISSAFAANLGGMGTLFNGRLSAAEIADLAAFIGNPNVSAAPAASVNPASLGFSAVTVGQAGTPLATTLSNTGNAALNVAMLSLGGAAAGDYSIGGGTCTNGGTLAPGSSCSVQIGFRPSAAGARTATLTIAHNGAGGASSVALSGTGNAAPQATVAVSASALNFTALAGGAAPPAQSITVSNTGQAALSFSAIALGGANAGAFTLGGTCSTATPVAAGASCTVTVGVGTAVSGAVSGSLALASNASNGTVTVALSGTVAAAAPAIAATPSAVSFGAQTVGAGAGTQDVVLANTGNVLLVLNGVAVSGAAAIRIAARTCGATLAVGERCSVTLAFAPTAPGAVAATLAVTSNAAPLQVAVSGSGTTAPVARPTLSDTGPLAFADTQVGRQSASHTLTLANAGTAALKLTSLALGGAQAADFVLGGSCAVDASVGPGAGCTIDIGFKPAAPGQRTATLVLMTDAGSQFSVALGGTGIAVPVPLLTVNPQSFDFGSADVNGSAPTHHITVTNAGGNPAALTGATFSGPFALQADAGACAAFPFTLQPGAGCDLVVRFAPTSGGDASGSLVLAVDSGTAVTVALSGKGNAGGAPAAAGAQAPQNAGGGGCSSITGGNDPVLALLVVLSVAVLAWRRHGRKPEEQS